MRLQYSLRALLCVMLVLAVLSVWQRDRAARLLSAIASAGRHGEDSREHDKEEPPPPALDDVALAMREFQIEEGMFYAERSRAQAEMERQAGLLLRRDIHVQKDDLSAARARLEALRANSVKPSTGPPPSKGADVIPTDVPGLGDL